jgi:hypothetical protein
MVLQAVAENRDGLLVRIADADEAAVVDGVCVYLVGGPSRGGGIPLRRGRDGTRECGSDSCRLVLSLPLP